MCTLYRHRECGASRSLLECSGGYNRSKYSAADFRQNYALTAVHSEKVSIGLSPNTGCTSRLTPLVLPQPTSWSITRQPTAVPQINTHRLRLSFLSLTCKFPTPAPGRGGKYSISGNLVVPQQREATLILYEAIETSATQLLCYDLTFLSRFHHLIFPRRSTFPAFFILRGAVLVITLELSAHVNHSYTGRTQRKFGQEIVRYRYKSNTTYRNRHHTQNTSMKDNNTSIFSILRDRSDIPHLRPDELRNELNFIRSQNDEVYKVILTPVIANALTRLISNEEKNIKSQQRVFDAPEAPSIALSDYLDRIVRYTPCSPETYILALLFLDRLSMGRDIPITSLNVHRLLFTSVLIASKTLDDTTYNNKYYSYVAGIDLQELNGLERKFLNLIDYNLNVSLENFEFYRMAAELNSISAVFQCTRDVLEEFNATERQCTTKKEKRERNRRLRRSRSFTKIEECRNAGRRRSLSTSSPEPLAA
ncbi:hypothetical protein PROFUN_14067 [Planoprotostelium fungivorum]|uniref:Uncharacterized protein n=1 Tax=Planoprotostelium fungivorum TaxID=1890364 RepID=A0A2P6N1Y7_9EUKA|nr:hypothetical protein PROFUN_14067 [Planoprotostelium fungivorum]